MEEKNRIEIAKGIKVIEWLKTELITQISSLFKGMLEGKEELIMDSLASLIVTIYVIARRMGFNFHRLEEAVKEKLAENKNNNHQLEEWYGDLSSLEQHWKTKR